ncbi:hypothetical protein GCM10022252_20780 [Streptosporangium oxazolinicum]|uniref:Uncharacterized protein n=1 Tax=Streptosporangium oxazolinicum TaxID=909287 RepID=A0ABP8APH7_9ACTN|nr:MULTISPECIES: hypothetical protein [unclassified Streptosporangium]
MIKFAQRAGERLLTHLLPSTTAGAICIPQTYCSHCGGGWYKRHWIFADCSSDYTACGDC